MLAAKVRELGDLGDVDAGGVRAWHPLSGGRGSLSAQPEELDALGADGAQLRTDFRGLHWRKVLDKRMLVKYFTGVPRKDRSYIRILASDAEIIVERSSEQPVEYAVTLRVLRDGKWHTVRSFDNAHHMDEHHEHRYIGTEKQPPIVTRGTWNEAMAEAERKLLKGWQQIVRSWEQTR